MAPSNLTSWKRRVQAITSLGKKSQDKPKQAPDGKHTKFNPPTVAWLLEHRNEHREAKTVGDTPQAALYRMFEYIVTANTTGLRNEIEAFFNRPAWAISEIPDPSDDEADRYAILSVLPIFLVMAFNRLIERGLPRGAPAIICNEDWDELRSKPPVLEQVPAWVTNVPKLDKTLVIPDADAKTPSKEYRSESFLKMNIIVTEPHVLFV